MNSIKTLLNHDNRRKLFNLLRPTSYYLQPLLNINKIPDKRWKMLLTMRDLRMWVEQNAPFSSRAKKFHHETYQINMELNYLQMRGKFLFYKISYDTSYIYICGFNCIFCILGTSTLERFNRSSWKTCVIFYK